jgi:hypothetical protein
VSTRATFGGASALAPLATTVVKPEDPSPGVDSPQRRGVDAGLSSVGGGGKVGMRGRPKGPLYRGWSRVRAGLHPQPTPQ